ncbi:hypothetical protein ACFLSY_02165 [Bacteroidota bacterium]
MKNTILLFIGLLLLICSFSAGKERSKNKISHQDSISIYSTPELYNLTRMWTDEFCSLNPDVKIEVINATVSSMTNILIKGRDLCFSSNGNYSLVNDGLIWKEVVGRDVIVPIININNPFLDEINQLGISSEELAQIFKNPEMQNWGTLLNNGQNVPVNYYMINDEIINSGVADFLNLNQNAISGIIAENVEELVSSIQKDPYAIGFSRLGNIFDMSNQSIVENIELLPIDKNGNGKIDYVEKIYDDLNVLSRGVWIGKYPRALYNNIYSVSHAKPTNEIEVAFLKWVLTDGQQFMNPYGYSDLVLSERQTKVAMLYDNTINISSPNDNFALSKAIIIIIVAFLAAFFIVLDVVQFIKYKKTVARDVSSISPPGFDEDSVLIPKGLYYDITHTWAFMKKDGMVKIGIDDFLQRITGTLTRVRMRKPGGTVKKGEQVLSLIQNGKQLNIYSPISGTIKAQNESLITNSSLINSSPYSDGWVYMIEPINWLREIRFLIMEKKYKEWLKSEFSRLKDFLAVSIKPINVEYAHSVLQDGGELRESILEDLGPEIWEEFQTNFIDTSK